MAVSPSYSSSVYPSSLSSVSAPPLRKSSPDVSLPVSTWFSDKIPSIPSFLQPDLSRPLVGKLGLDAPASFLPESHRPRHRYPLL